MQLPHRPEDDTEYSDPDFEERLAARRDEGISPVIVLGALVGLAVGLFLWGSIALSAFSGLSSVFDSDSSLPANDAGSDESDSAPPDQQESVIDCDAFGPTRALSPEQEAAYQEQCETPTPEPDEDDASPADASLNRDDCGEIRGSDYRSPEEREWFLDNCVN